MMSQQSNSEISPKPHYAGFWIRVLAAAIDSVLVLMLIAPILYAIYGADYFLCASLETSALDIVLNYILPAVVIIVFWITKSATPGKMICKLTIVDAKTGAKPTTAQFIGRYLGYYVSTIPLLVGLIWVAFDDRKQGWHDKLAGTVVVKQ